MSETLDLLESLQHQFPQFEFGILSDGELNIVRREAHPVPSIQEQAKEMSAIGAAVLAWEQQNKGVDWGKPLQTDEVTNNRVIELGMNDGYHVIVVERSTYWLECRAWKDGAVLGEGFRIINVPAVAPKRKVVRYLNLYPDGTVSSWASDASANAAAQSNRIACQRVEIEEGRFDP